MGKTQLARTSSPDHGAATDEQNPYGESRNLPTNISIESTAEDLASRPFRFLDLPQELRNEIYEYDLRNCNYIRLVKKGRIVSNSNLHLVSRQVNDELAALLINTARASYGKLYYPVTDFEFKPTMFAALRWLANDTSVTSIVAAFDLEDMEQLSIPR